MFFKPPGTYFKQAVSYFQEKNKNKSITTVNSIQIGMNTA